MLAPPVLLVLSGGLVPSTVRAASSTLPSSNVLPPSVVPAMSARTANSATVGSSATRRVTNASTSRLGSSSHCTSSAISSTGALAAASLISSSVASPIRNAAEGSASVMPNADSSAARCRGGQPLGLGQHRPQELVQPRER